MTNIIKINNLFKIYGQKETKLSALDNINLEINKGEFIAIMGPSGCGKSTLLNIIGCLDKSNSGKYILDGREINKKISNNILAQIRRKKIGFIFQSFNLLRRTSTINNVLLPAVYSNLKNRKEKALELIKKVGLEKRIKYTSNKLSGGEQQRVAIARALMNDPEIILADEPTGNLDSKSGAEIIKLLQDLNKEGKTVIVVTHSETIAKNADRIIRMMDGKIQKSVMRNKIILISSAKSGIPFSRIPQEAGSCSAG